MSTIILTTGQPGSGKSYSRVRWLISDYLINNTGIYITNIPINKELIAEYLSKKTGKPLEAFLDRLQIIPPDELKLWEQLQHENRDSLKNMKEGNSFLPSIFFDKFDLANAHIAIDEFHLYFCKQHPAGLKQLWNDWFAEIRKLGCTFEAITQDASLLPREFIGKVGTTIDLVPLKNTRDPFFGILMGDWYELRGGFIGIVEQKVQEQEKIKVSSLVGTKWKLNHQDRFSISSDYYQFYNSYQRNDNYRTGKTQTPAEIYGKKIGFWFLRRNFFKLLGRFMIAGLVIWLCFGGGIVFLLSQFTGILNTMAGKNGAKITQTAKKDNIIGVPATVSPESLPAQVQAQKAEQIIAENLEKDEKISYKPSLFFDGFVWLRNGLKITKDYQFIGGCYDQKKVVTIDEADRFYALDDGTIIGMF